MTVILQRQAVVGMPRRRQSRYYSGHVTSDSESDTHRTSAVDSELYQALYTHGWLLPRLDTKTPSNVLIEESTRVGAVELSNFARQVLLHRLIMLASITNRWHCDLLNAFIMTAYDMARDQNITPKRLQFAK